MKKSKLYSMYHFFQMLPGSFRHILCLPPTLYIHVHAHVYVDVDVYLHL